MGYNPIETFLQEADELLANIEQSTLSLGTEKRTEEIVHELFRAFHTIKGSSAMCGLDAVSAFTHHVEGLLDRVRTGSVPVSPELADVVLKAKDYIKALLSSDPGSEAASPDSGEALIATIEGFSNSATSGKSDAVESAPARATDAAGAEQTWRVRFRPGSTLLLHGGNPTALINELRNLGACVVTAHAEDIPPLETLEPDVCYVWWDITLRTTSDENAIHDVFIFVEDSCELKIEKVPSEIPETAAGQRQGRNQKLGIQPGIRAGGSGGSRQKALYRESTVRVPAERLDRLVNLVGELVMNQSRLAQAVSQNVAPEFSNPVQELERLVSELRDNVLGIRMLPIGTLFDRFRRLVHDLSAELGKEAELVTEGAETELDKSILDQLGEPMVHCLRNCLDHGVETPEDRTKAGKPRRGSVHLSAVHRGSDVVISIQDDGRGIDRDAVRAKALERQLIAPEANLSDKDIFNLVLMPGFSTAQKITNVSGRGVGMDAVKRQIDALRGTLSLTSEPGQGTLISITLPLTLAIIEGLLVQLGGDQFIVPLSAVTENIELSGEERLRKNGRNVTAVRGELIPYIDLRRTFQIEDEAPSIEKVIIVQHEGERVGLVVDRVLGTHQTVIQSLGRFFREMEVISGATIMGDGRVALILDINAVVRLADDQEQATRPIGPNQRMVA
ncbi:MAG: chemotaxis protein CheA [Bryobacteraceae bacterium]